MRRALPPLLATALLIGAPVGAAQADTDAVLAQDVAQEDQGDDYGDWGLLGLLGLVGLFGYKKYRDSQADRAGTTSGRSSGLATDDPTGTAAHAAPAAPIVPPSPIVPPAAPPVAPPVTPTPPADDDGLDDRGSGAQRI